MRLLVVNGNKIEMEFFSLFSGKETIYYNGEIVSQKRSLFGGVHLFTVQEVGMDVQYEIRQSWTATVEIRRNGELIYAERVISERGVQF